MKVDTVITACQTQAVAPDTLLDFFLARMSRTLGGHDTLRLRPRFTVGRRVGGKPNWVLGAGHLTMDETAAYYEALDWAKARYELDELPFGSPKLH